MKTRLNILLAFCTVLAVLTFSSATVLPAHQDTEQTKTEKKDSKEENEKHLVVEFDALISATSFFVPAFAIDHPEHVAPVVADTEVPTFYFELTSQEFFRIFFTHIISKNAP